MKARINLTIDEILLDKVKHYAHLKQRSISDLVESYFRSFIDVSSTKSISFVDLVEELPKTTLPEDIEDTMLYYTALQHKLDVIISNDQHFQSTALPNLPALSPQEFIGRYLSEKNL